jgi:anti-sigma-K factor RskA
VNIESYISSGILESYVMGWATEEEILEVEAMAAKYPEIRAEIENIQNSLEEYAVKYSKSPPGHLKEDIWAQIQKMDHHVIDIQAHKESSKNATPVYKYLVAASVSLLIISAALNMFLYSKYTQVKEEMVALTEEKNTLASQFQIEQTHYSNAKKELDVVMKPMTKIIPLKGLAIAPTALATIYWNNSTKDTYLNVNELPKPASGKQYQLWAIVDGKPVDAGVLDVNGTVEGLQKMKNIDAPQAFAITLENQGGSASPTMDAMYVMGQI